MFRKMRRKKGVIITQGTQGALFLAVAATAGAGEPIAIMEPDYFANRKIAAFLDAKMLPVRLDYSSHSDKAGINIGQLEDAFIRLNFSQDPKRPRPRCSAWRNSSNAIASNT